jgi:putative membrane protein
VLTVITWVFALISAVVYLLAFVWETILFRRPGVHQGIFSVPAGDVEPVRLWSFCVGFYNLFLGLGAVAGVIIWAVGEVSVGRALVIYTCLFMAGCGVVLFIADRLALGRPKGSGVSGSIASTVPGAIAVLTALFTG